MRPIKKKWFTSKEGSVLGNLTVLTAVGDEPIDKQIGTSTYHVASGRVKLMNGVPTIIAGTGIIGDARLQHNGKNVRKITQYLMYYFDGTGSSPWRDNATPINLIGALNPSLTEEGETESEGIPDISDMDGDGLPDTLLFVGIDAIGEDVSLIITEDDNSVNIDTDGDGIADIIIPKT